MSNPPASPLTDFLTPSELPDFERWLNSSESRRAEMDRLLAGITPPLWTPFPDRDGKPSPQRQAYDSPADVLGYGGSAGGGKSSLLLGLAVTRHIRSIIFRREATQGRALIDDARQLLAGLGRFNENTGVWRDLPDGRQIEFAGCKDAGDEQRYRGRPHDFIGFDEADQFLEYQARFLQGWLRTTTPGQRCRVVLTFNPPSSAEGRWLLSFFGPWIDRKHPNPALPGELRWYATLPDGKEVERPNGSPFDHHGELIQPLSRTFIPARVTDNPYLMKTGYPAQLQALPEPLRSQLLYGDFHAGIEDDEWQVIPTAWVEAAMARWKPDGHGGHRLDAIGVDVARGGAAKTVIAPRHGPWFAPLKKYPGSSTPDGPAVVRLVVEAIRSNPQALVNIDTLNVGYSPVDWARGLNVGRLQPINFGGPTADWKSKGGLRAVNVRAKSYWLFRELLDPSEKADLALPPDRELLADLTAARWKITPRGIQLEEKKEIIKRIGRSPDCADAVVLAALVRK